MYELLSLANVSPLTEKFPSLLTYLIIIWHSSLQTHLFKFSFHEFIPLYTEELINSFSSPAELRESPWILVNISWKKRPTSETVVELPHTASFLFQYIKLLNKKKKLLSFSAFYISSCSKFFSTSYGPISLSHSFNQYWAFQALC